jgi:hypothetical protein
MLYITHIRLSGGREVQHITHVRWEQPSKDRSNACVRADIVTYIRHGVRVGVRSKGRDIEVVVVDVIPPFIRTVADGRETDNLLSLPYF